MNHFLKKSAFFLLFFSLVFCVCLGSLAASQSIEINGGIKITIDGKPFTPTDVNGNAVDVFESSGTTYLPVRAIAGAVGYNVSWDAAARTVILTSDSQQSSSEVYITRTGSKYHYDGSCNGGTYWPVPFETALGMGLDPCSKCVK